MMGTQDKQPITAAEVTLRERQEGAGREIINGAWLDVKEQGGKLHDSVANKIYLALLNHIKPNRLGQIYSNDMNYILTGNTQSIITMRVPDASFISAAVTRPITIDYMYFAPDLAVEVVAPAQSQEDVTGKVTDFLESGTPYIWVIDPQARTVAIHKPQGATKTLHEGDTLQGEEYLSGFSIKVANLFDGMDA